MTDQCKHCKYRGDLKECRAADCSQHESWCAQQQQRTIDEMDHLIINIQQALRELSSIADVALVQVDHARSRPDAGALTEKEPCNDIKLDWKKTKDVKPNGDDLVVVMTRNGERKAQVKYGNHYGWKLRDCTHPEQNAYLSFDDGNMWRAIING